MINVEYRKDIANGFINQFCTWLRRLFAGNKEVYMTKDEIFALLKTAYPEITAKEKFLFDNEFDANVTWVRNMEFDNMENGLLVKSPDGCIVAERSDTLLGAIESLEEEYEKYIELKEKHNF